MNTKEYKQLCATGSSEPERRRSMDFSATKGKAPDVGVKGYHACRRGEDPRSTKPKVRIAVIRKNGNPYLSPVVSAEKLDAYWNAR